jgi:hypothetical protein
MKPLEDDQLKKILQDRILKDDFDVPDGHWQRISDHLPSLRTRYHYWAVPGVILLITSLLYFSKEQYSTSDVEYEMSKQPIKNEKIPDLSTEQRQYSHSLRSDVITQMSERETANIHIVNEGPRNIMPKSNHQSNTLLFKSNKVNDMIPTYNGFIIVPNNQTFQVKPPGKPVLQFPILHSFNHQNFNSRFTLFTQLSTFLTYHTINPDHWDESIITADKSRRPRLIDRTGIRHSLGVRRQLNDSWSLSLIFFGELMRSKMYFNRLSEPEPATSLINKRINIGSKLSLGYNFLRIGEIETGIGFTRMVNRRNNAIQYPKSYLHYDFRFLYDFGKYKLGPYYSSFITGDHYDRIGQIKPNSFGFTLRMDFE